MEFGGSGNWVRRHHERTNATNVWHSDDNYVLEPPWVTTLKAVKVCILNLHLVPRIRRIENCPNHAMLRFKVLKVGGDTCFCDMTQVWDDLAEETKTLLSNYMCETDWVQGD